VVSDADGVAQDADADRTVRIVQEHPNSRKKPKVVFGPINTQPKRIKTSPVTFFMLERVLLTVRPADAPPVGAVRERLLGNAARPPASPEDLAHRILNAMVDHYLELRQPLSDRLDRMQRNLLDPKRPFNDWYALLEQRTELRKLEHLCEEQYDAVQEWRDSTLDDELNSFAPAHTRADAGAQAGSGAWESALPAGERMAAGAMAGGPGIAATALPVVSPMSTQTARTHFSPTRRSDAMMVRINDLLEHINRVRHHAERLESTAESAVQLHFSAMAHRTSEIMRTLTILTAIFLPLTLITGIFGMNFKEMPLIDNHHGFAMIVLGMVSIAVVLLVVFRQKRYIETRAERGLQERK
jgi:magnesium transporter